MKWIFNATVLGMVLLISGCSSHYVMTTKDGKMIMTDGKPQINKETGLVEYTDDSGHEMQINSDDVSSIVER